MGTDQSMLWLFGGPEGKINSWVWFGHLRNDKFTLIIKAEKGEWAINREQAGLGISFLSPRCGLTMPVCLGFQPFVKTS